MAVVNISLGGYDLSDELNEAVSTEKARAEAAEKAISDQLDGVADALSKI